MNKRPWEPECREGNQGEAIHLRLQVRLQILKTQVLLTWNKSYKHKNACVKEWDGNQRTDYKSVFPKVDCTQVLL